jgi:hypothetical protein
MDGSTLSVLAAEIELRRGKLLLGQTRQSGSGKITGLGVGTRYDGVQVPFFSHGKKLKYYDSTLDDTVEIGSDILGAGGGRRGCLVRALQQSRRQHRVCRLP